MRLAETLVSTEAIDARIAELAAEIDAFYAGIKQPLVLLCVLKGSLFFTVDLSRHLTVPAVIDCIAVRSYGEGIESSGSVEMTKDVGMALRDRDVLMVEDIIDTGLTTSFLYEHIERHQPRSLRLVALLNKQGRRIKDVRLDWFGFEIPNQFVVGYGLDHAELYRNLRDVRLLESDHAG